MKFGFRIGADVESGSHVRRLIHSWTTWNDGRNESKRILEKIFGSETNGGDGGDRSLETGTGGIDEYVVNVNPDDVIEDYYETTEAGHSELTWCAYNIHPKSPSPFWRLSEFSFYE